MVCVVFLGVLRGAAGDIQFGVFICQLRPQGADEVVGIKARSGGDTASR